MSELGGVEAGGAGPITEAASLGLPLLVQIVEGMADGILMCDEDRRCVYVNPATCEMLGRPARDLVGYGYEQVIPRRDLVAARQYFVSVLEGSTEFVTQMLIGADGEEREFVHASFRVLIDGRPHGAALIRDFTDARTARRSAAALAQSAAELVGDASTDEILSGIARHAVDGTCATWAGLAVVGEAGGFAFAGGYGPAGAEFADSSEAHQALRTAPAASILEAMAGGAFRAGEVPTRPVMLTRSLWEQDLDLSTYGQAVLQHEWQSAVCLPLSYDNRVTGALLVLLPDGSTALDDAEVTFCTALADYAAVAAATEHLARRAARGAELRERARVARELHDSVSQALFAMTMHARSAQLVLARAGVDTDPRLARSLDQLSQLARSTLAEMRALIFELRPEALADEGLLGALRTQAAAVSARGQLPVAIDGPTGRLPIEPEAEAELYRVVSTALRELAERSGAESVTVALSIEDHQLRTTIRRHGGPAGSPAGLKRSAGSDRDECAAAIGARIELSDDGQFVQSIVVPLAGPPGRAEAGP